MSVTTAVRAFRPDTMLESVRSRSTFDALVAARPSGQVVAVCGLRDEAGGSTVAMRLAALFGRFHPGRVVVLDADLDRGALLRRTEPESRLELDDLEAFLRTPSSVPPPWASNAPVVGNLGAYPADHVAELLRWSRPRLDTVVIDVPSRWRRAVLESLLSSLDVLVVAARAHPTVEEEVGVARHWLAGQGRPDLADRLIVVESDLDSGPASRSGRRRRGDRRFRFGWSDPAAGWSGLDGRDRVELLRLGAALRR